MTHNSAPRSIGIILDGNRRWAREHNLPTLEGHRRGYDKLKDLMRWAKEAGVEYVTIFAFSTENWNREEKEVSYLMDLFLWALENEVEEMSKEGFRLRYIGDLSRLSPKLQELIAKVEKQTARNPGPTLVSAISYGGRDEIIRGIKRVAGEKTKSEIQKLTEKDFSRFLDAPDVPDPELIIRTSGEMRTSGFLPWQSVYSELFFTKTYWPAFSKEEFFAILEDFGKRQRRHGK